MPRKKQQQPTFEPGSYVRVIDTFTGDIDDGNGDTLPFVGRAEKVYSADHPAVKKWPHHFEALEPERQRPRVEQATAAPGEGRPVRA